MRYLAFLALLCNVLAPRLADGPEEHSAAAVIADDEGWAQAEIKGDVAYVDELLLPEYRSVRADGKVDDKGAILNHTRKASPERAAMIAKWQDEHPMLKSATIIGDTAILTFTQKNGGDSKVVMSCDVFVYRDGRWRALYSQHTTAEA